MSSTRTPPQPILGRLKAHPAYQRIERLAHGRIYRSVMKNRGAMLLLQEIAIRQGEAPGVLCSGRSLLGCVEGRSRMGLKRARDVAIASGLLLWRQTSRKGQVADWYQLTLGPPDPPSRGDRSVTAESAVTDSLSCRSSGGFRNAKAARRSP